MKKNIIVGKITGVHGVRGELKFSPLLDNPVFLKKINMGLLIDEKTADRHTYEEEESDDYGGINIQITSWRITEGRCILLLDGVSDRDQARKYIGFFLLVERSVVPSLPKGRFFITDLLGSVVTDDDRGVLGNVKNILQTGANDVFVVSRQDEKDVLIPFLNQVVYSIDQEKKEIHVRLPDGLYEIYRN